MYLLYSDKMLPAGNLHLSPAPEARYTHWKQTVFYVEDCLTVKLGEQLTGLFAVSPNTRNKVCSFGCLFSCLFFAVCFLVCFLLFVFLFVCLSFCFLFVLVCLSVFYFLAFLFFLHVSFFGYNIQATVHTNTTFPPSPSFPLSLFPSLSLSLPTCTRSEISISILPSISMGN